ncbi:MAG: hypothetical protein WB809_07330 [Thermoplasmata archaeon]
MPSEMISGPDLGAGYLHQLTIDREGERTTFTYHAQEGGQDAGGPPKGSLEPYGYTHPPSPCQFGGSRCWHRRFLLPFAETAKVRMAYNRSRFVLEAMLGQTYDAVPVNVKTALGEVAHRLQSPLAAEGVDWYIGGSTAAWLLGARLDPHDIDLGTSRPGVDRIAALLTEYLIEPVGPTDWPHAGIVHGARAFVGTFREGARVEWSVPIDPTATGRWGEWTGRTGEARTLAAEYDGVSLRVTRPEYALVRAWESNAPKRVDSLLPLVRRIGPDRELLGELIARSTLVPDVRKAVFRSLDV